MSDAITEGAVMPEGIEVDEAAAYFGVVDTSDAVHQLMAMNRFEAMENFFAQLSDIVLTTGEFDFEAASERMQCEGGEIYFLVAGHLSLLNVTDPLLNYLGLEDSLGQGAGNCQREATGADYDSLKELSDPMKILKLLAIAYTTGGKGEVTRYFNGFETLITNPGANESALLSIANELIISLDVAGHALPIPTLASGKAASAAVAIPAATAKPAVQTKQEVVPLQTPAHESIPLPSEGTIPLPSAESNVAVPIPIPVPVMSAEIEQAPVNNENLKEVAKATQDAFAGAFNIGVEEETAPVVEEEIAPVVEEETAPVAVPQEVIEEIQPEVVQVEQLIVTKPEDNEPQQDKFVSAAEHFIAADSDGSGQLSIEELAEATDTTIEEATLLHAQADTDGDGSVSLSEFMSSAAGEKAASLPKPVAPVRKPLNDNGQPKVEQGITPTPQPRPIQSNQQQQQQQWNQQQQQQQQEWNQQQQLQQQQQQQWQQQQLQQQQLQQQQQWQQQQQQQQWNQQQQQGWNQPPTAVQPTIRSGVMCRGCGIGLDPNWKHCPICGSANAGY